MSEISTKNVAKTGLDQGSNNEPAFASLGRQLRDFTSHHATQVGTLLLAALLSGCKNELSGARVPPEPDGLASKPSTQAERTETFAEMFPRLEGGMLTATAASATNHQFPPLQNDSLRAEISSYIHDAQKNGNLSAGIAKLLAAQHVGKFYTINAGGAIEPTQTGARLIAAAHLSTQYVGENLLDFNQSAVLQRWNHARTDVANQGKFLYLLEKIDRERLNDPTSLNREGITRTFIFAFDQVYPNWSPQAALQH